MKKREPKARWQTEACIDWLGVGELLGGVHVIGGGGGGGGVTNAANQD